MSFLIGCVIGFVAGLAVASIRDDWRDGVGDADEYKAGGTSSD